MNRISLVSRSFFTALLLGLALAPSAALADDLPASCGQGQELNPGRHRSVPLARQAALLRLAGHLDQNIGRLIGDCRIENIKLMKFEGRPGCSRRDVYAVDIELSQEGAPAARVLRLNSEGGVSFINPGPFSFMSDVEKYSYRPKYADSIAKLEFTFSYETKDLNKIVGTAKPGAPADAAFACGTAPAN